LTARSRDAALPDLADFPYRLSDNVRFADLDPNNHVNNAVYSSYFESGRVSLVKDKANGLMPPGLSWVLVRLDIHFRSELHWPGKIELGLGVVRLGRTSTHFDQVVFSEGICVASARSITVLVNEQSRKPTPLTPEIIVNLKRWALRGVELA